MFQPFRKIKKKIDFTDFDESNKLMCCFDFIAGEPNTVHRSQISSKNY